MVRQAAEAVRDPTLFSEISIYQELFLQFALKTTS